MIEIEKPTIECIYSPEEPNYGKFVVEPAGERLRNDARKQPEKNTALIASGSCRNFGKDRRNTSRVFNNSRS